MGFGTAKALNQAISAPIGQQQPTNIGCRDFIVMEAKVLQTIANMTTLDGSINVVDKVMSWVFGVAHHPQLKRQLPLHLAPALQVKRPHLLQPLPQQVQHRRKVMFV